MTRKYHNSDLGKVAMMEAQLFLLRISLKFFCFFLNRLFMGLDVMTNPYLIGGGFYVNGYILASLHLWVY